MSIAVAVGVLSGVACRVPVRPSEPTQRLTSLGSENQFRDLWESCLFVLRRHRFRIDRADLRAGVITTFPETSQSALEFWRRDVASAYDLAESAVHTLRRYAVISIRPPQSGNDYILDVTVNRERFDTEERQINNAAAAPRMFSISLPTVRGSIAAAERWIPDGRDGMMEQRLLESILEHYQRNA